LTHFFRILLFMTILLKAIGTPMVSAVTTSELSDYLRTDSADDTALLDRLGLAATQHIVKHSRHTLTTQSWQITFDTWSLANTTYPVSGGNGRVVGHPASKRQYSRLPRPPVVSVDSVAVMGQTNWQTIAPETYTVHNSHGDAMLMPRLGTLLPEPCVPNGGIVITYTSGYGGAVDVPPLLKQAVLMLCAHWYENRDGSHDIPMEIDALLAGLSPVLF
jgi:hypothetical protein